MLTQEYVKKIFFVDDDGDLFFRATGRIATHNHGKYLRVWFNGTKYYAHHIIWCLIHDEWPRYIDHKDGDPHNNRPDNLRAATMSQNIANADFGDLRGIEQHGRRFRVRVKANGVRVIVGTYDTKEQAVEAYKIWAVNQFGEYAFHMR